MRAERIGNIDCTSRQLRESDWGQGGLGVLAQRGQARLLQVVAVEEVVGVEGDEAAVGVDYVDAGFLDAAYVEGVGIDELHDDDAENIFVGDTVGDEDFGETAEKFAEGAGSAARRVVGGEEFEEIGADGGVLFVEDGVGGAVNEDFRGDHAG